MIWPDEQPIYHCEMSDDEVLSPCVFQGRPWLNEPDRPACKPEDCPVIAIYRREPVDAQ